MKSSLRFAIAAALGTGALWSGSAMAVLPSTVPAENILYFSGATATDQQMEDLARLSAAGGLCTAGTIDIFRGSNQRVTLCTGRGTGLAGNIGIAKESLGGSGNGIQPVAINDPLVWLDVKAAGFACGGTDNNIATNDAGTFNLAAGINVPAVLAATATLVAANQYTNCTPNTAPRLSMAGISDVEAGLFGFTGSINQRPLGQILFGVPVSLNLYRALQVAQGITATAACDTPAEQDTDSCVPSLTKGQIAAIYSGNIVSWDQLFVNGVALSTAAGVAAPADANVYICRRGNTSGTQVFTRSYALNQGCGGGDAFRAADSPACEADGCTFPTSGAIPADFVYANFSSGNVRDCLDQRDDDNRWAIGVLSTENTVNDIGGTGGDARDALGTGGAESHTREFRFVGINGFNPSLEVAANGGYDMVSENVCTVNTARLGVNPGGTLRTALFNRMCGDVASGTPAGLSDLNLVRAINESFDNQPHGDGGNMAKTDFVSYLVNTGPVSQSEMEANPVNAYTRSAGGSVNNCSPYQSIGDTDVSAARLRGPVLPGDVTP
jgi:PBP superfamily domain